MRAIPSSLRKLLLASAAVLAVTAGFLTASVVSPATTPAEAADMSGFQAGNIIDDALFWDANAMSEADIQAFLNARVSQCRSGYTCLKDYRETTRTIGATPMCSQYNGVANESAATIIFKIAQTCGISPKVLLVVLQKEQSLVTDTWPTTGQYRSAMGAGCPDTAACDSDYYGFFNQVHYGAYLLKRYTQPAGTGPGTDYTTRYDQRYPVGQVSAILYNPDAACGAQNVLVANQATHALYIYTPYTPNAAALATSNGIGDGCSAYGNRNFFTFYTDWFGSTRGNSVGSYFRDYYAANDTWLGYATTPMTCGRPDSGCVQTFQGGIVSGSYSTVAAGTRNAYAQVWGWYGRELGPLGYPVTEYRCDNMLGDGCRQEFQGGWIVTFSGNTTVVMQSVREVWSAYGREFGPLGTPTSGHQCADMVNSCRQSFQGGWIVDYPGATSPYVMPNPVRDVWASLNRESGVLGLPIGSATDPTAATYTQAFRGGVVTVTNGVGAVTSYTDPWFNTILTSPWLGSSIQAKSCTLKDGACYQAFQNGWLVQSAGGVVAVPTAVLSTWGAYGREYNILGFPTGAPSASPTTGNYTQAFQGGTITVTNGAGALTASTDPWLGTILSSTWLGSSTQAKSCTLKGGACYQAFQNGWVVQSPSGVYALPTVVVQNWGWYGRELNVLGFPTSAPSAAPSTGNYTQTFQGGTITVTGGIGAVTLPPDPWTSAIQSATWLGSSTQGKSCTLTGGVCYQVFQNGWVVQGTNVVVPVPALVVQYWGWYGRELGPLGFPTGAPSASPTAGNYTQAFQGGTITVTGGVGAVAVAPDAWTSAVQSSTWLGSSIQAKSCTLKGGACYEAFQNGWVVQSPSGVYALPTVVVQNWGWYGRELNVLGFPTSAPSAAPTTGNYTQTFQGGTITVTGGIGAVTLR
ncbi:MAG: hypothetical protein JWP19_2710 [Rhodoglobus sp.]|nr:hypothetical protein [Rhodoglobus sp.]